MALPAAGPNTGHGIPAHAFFLRSSGLPPMPLLLTPRPGWFALCLVPLLGCSPQAPSGPAQTAFDALVAACTQFAAAREAQVRPGASGEWTKTGYSPAQVQSEVTRTESAITPYVAKIVIKDNEAQATATTEAAARAVTLTPAHLLSNRTHTSSTALMASSGIGKTDRS
jgi:hypothetical protein